jgi:hypothetical protein
MAKKKTENEIGDKILAAALKAYGIDEKFVLDSAFNEETGEVVIVTNGGSKIRFKEGDKPQPLSDIAITGINPAAAKRKVIAGKAKE